MLHHRFAQRANLGGEYDGLLGGGLFGGLYCLHRVFIIIKTQTRNDEMPDAQKCMVT